MARQIKLRKVKTHKCETYYRVFDNNGKEKLLRITRDSYFSILSKTSLVSEETTFIKGKCINGSKDKSVNVTIVEVNE